MILHKIFNKYKHIIHDEPKFQFRILVMIKLKLTNIYNKINKY